jgi:hypothetical protein
MALRVVSLITRDGIQPPYRCDQAHLTAVAAHVSWSPWFRENGNEAGARGSDDEHTFQAGSLTRSRSGKQASRTEV